jgi:hypothetical protein
VDSRDIFKDLKIVDFSWVGVGPMSTQHFAFLGAEVLRVESAYRLDTFRNGQPLAPGTGPDRSAYWANVNRDKFGMTLNLRHEKAPEVVRRLVERADVVTESFSPGFMHEVGFDYENLRKINPGVIMISMSMEGQGGPHLGFKGFGLGDLEQRLDDAREMGVHGLARRVGIASLDGFEDFTVFIQSILRAHLAYAVIGTADIGGVLADIPQLLDGGQDGGIAGRLGNDQVKLAVGHMGGQVAVAVLLIHQIESFLQLGQFGIVDHQRCQRRGFTFKDGASLGQFEGIDTDIARDSNELEVPASRKGRLVNGAHEALLFGYKAGLDLETVMKSVSTGAAGSWSLSNLGPRIMADNFDPGFFVEHFIKDMGIALAEAKRMDLSLPGLALAHQLYVAVKAQGHGRDGTHALMLALAKMSEVDWKKR